MSQNHLPWSLGSSFTSSVPFCIALAVRDMRMTPDEAVWSATAGGAAALRRDDIGRIASGTYADLTLLDPKRRRKVDPARFESKGRSTPFAGLTLKGWPAMTIVGGRVVWTA